MWSPLNLRLFAGDCLGLRGPSGCGKTRLLRALAQLDPLLSGEIWLQGQPASGLPVPHYRSQVLYVPQRAAFRAGSVAEHLAWVCTLGVYQGRTMAPLDWSSLGLSPHFGERETRQLSGGEQQKLALLQALSLSPTVLLLDEPTAALDPESTLQLESLVKQWLGTGERVCLWVSHQPSQLLRVASDTLNLTPQAADRPPFGPNGPSTSRGGSPHETAP